jgi:broad specificity phosphatase PhoE
MESINSLVGEERSLQDSMLTAGTQDQKNIYLIRHGQSIFNLPDDKGVFTTSGKSENAPLTEKGKKQAAALASKLLGKIQKEQEIVICSSTAVRAQETAKLLFDELSKHYKCTLGESYEGLLELGQGRWEGEPKDAAYQAEVKKWEALSPQEQLTTPKVPTAESLHDVSGRALAAAQQIYDKHRAKLILIVAHHATMHALSLHWAGCTPLTASTIPGSKLPPIKLDNC